MSNLGAKAARCILVTPFITGLALAGLPVNIEHHTASVHIICECRSVCVWGACVFACILAQSASVWGLLLPRNKLPVFLQSPGEAPQLGR